MQTKTTAKPVKTVLLLKSRWVRLVASWAAADFFRSATARFMPIPRFLRMRKRVKDAPTIMPPTAMGRTMLYQIVPATDAQPASPLTDGASWGPRKNASSGTSSPQANTPPAKFKAPSRGPIIYPTPRYAGLMAGAENVVMAPAGTEGAPRMR